MAGDLARRIEEATERARRSGALLAIPTTSEVVRTDGADWIVRVADSLARKDRARERAIEGRPDDPARNPFQPWEEDLWVADLGEDHVALLNKYNVVEGHLLVVTREFEHQTRLLGPGDMRALWACLGQIDGLGFYNGGVEAGASQPHKHLQMVGLPLGGDGRGWPLRAWWLDVAAGRRRLPFACRARALPAGVWNDPTRAADLTLDAYTDMMRSMGLADVAAGVQTAPYNLLVTREVVALAPRSREHAGPVSLNALAFAGSFFVRDGSQRDDLVRLGPLSALVSVGRAVD